MNKIFRTRLNAVRVILLLDTLSGGDDRTTKRTNNNTVIITVPHKQVTSKMVGLRLGASVLGESFVLKS